MIAGRYRLVDLIGRGAMGEVWRARDEPLDRVVAVKLLRADGPDGEEADRLGRREGRVGARVRHPHAIMVHDAVEHAGRPCLIMEYFPSRSLWTVLDADGPLPPDAVARIGAQIASALAAAHGEGVVHRDIKPGNVLLAADGTAKIADFGISRALGDGTATGSGIVGTPAYLAPEVARGEPASFASDVFSLGATLYTALEGTPPFGHDDNPIALLQRVAHSRITPPSRSGPLTGLLLWMLRDNPAERPLMSEVHEALATGQPVEPPPPRDPTLVLPARRFPRRAVLLGAGAAVLVATGVVIGTLIGREPAAVGTSTPPATGTSAPSSAATPSCAASYEVAGRWPGHYQVNVTVRNGTGSRLTGWTVRWQLPAGHSIDNLWNGDLVRDGSAVTVSDVGWNALVQPGESTSFGFNATGSGDDPPPTITCSSS